MISDAQILLAIKNIDLLIANVDSNASQFTIEDNKISKNWLSQDKVTGELKYYLQFLINEVSDIKPEHDKPLMRNLVTSLQYFLNIEKNQIVSDLDAESDLPLNLKNMGRLKLRTKRLGHMSPKNQFYGNDKVIHIDYAPVEGHYTASDDHQAHQHGAEASNIFFSTQFERFKGLLNWLFVKLDIHVFETTRYREHDYVDSDIYAQDTPTASISDNKSTQFYWIGHATNLFVFPNNGKPLHVLTDPFEGDMAPVIYPRMTNEGKLIEGEGNTRLPKVDVIIISHNHRDHVSEPTLKRLVNQQPQLIIPQGDKELFQKLGFKNIVELEWWEQARIKDGANNVVFTATAVPCRHWSGRELHDAHRSAFNGYVLSSNNKDEGDIYFAGDTALMEDANSQPIFDNFNIMTSIQPGGPDENREDMESTHQSSVDGIEMHFKMLLTHYQKMKTLNNGNNPTFDEFQQRVEQVKTIYNHTSTFKLGNLRLKDTRFSYQRLLGALKEDDQWRKIHLREHELKTYDRIVKLADTMVFDGDKLFDNESIITQILTTVIIPKIGQRQSLYSTQKMGPDQSFQHRYLITNRRALIEYDEILHRFVKHKKKVDFDDVQAVIINLLGSYQETSHSSFSSRTFTPKNMRNRYNEKISDCTKLDDLLKTLNGMEREMSNGKFNQHGHMQSLIHYARWVVDVAKENDDPAATVDQFKRFFVCQQVRKLVDQESNNTGSFLVSKDRSPKQEAFKTLGDRLANVSASEYKQVIDSWKGDRIGDQSNVELLSEHRSTHTVGQVTKSMSVVMQIDSLVSQGFFAVKPEDLSQYMEPGDEFVDLSQYMKFEEESVDKYQKNKQGPYTDI